jgi:hypothetical protein
MMTPVSASDIRTSPTSGKTCKHEYREDVHQRTCTGPGSYVAVITTRNQMMTINFSQPGTAPFDHDREDFDLLWRGRAPFVGDNIEWRLVDGKPVTAIIRIFTTAADDRPLQQFLVARITPAGSCEIARVDTSDADAYRTARHAAVSQVSNISCEFR